MIDKESVLKLREETGFGMIDCMKALEESDNDYEKAILYLAKKEPTLSWSLISYKRD